MKDTYQTIEKAIERKNNDSEKHVLRVTIPLSNKIGMKLTILCKMNGTALIHLGAQILEEFVSKHEDEHGDIFSNYDALCKGMENINAKKSTELVTNE